jgi:hypothetical protein
MISVLLTKDQDAVELHLDKTGLEDFIRFLTGLRDTQDHAHLMTPEWGGGELSSQQLNSESKTLNKLTIYSWPDGVS